MSILWLNLLSVTVVIPSLLPFDNTELQDALSDSNSSQVFFSPNVHLDHVIRAVKILVKDSK